MTVTQVDAAALLRTLGARLIQQVAVNGWNANGPYSTTITWQGPPLSIAEYVVWWNRFADRIESVPDDQMTDQFQAILEQIPAKVQATEPCIANMASDHGAPFRALAVLKDWIEDELPCTTPFVGWEDIKGSELVPRDMLRRLNSINTRAESDHSGSYPAAVK